MKEVCGTFMSFVHRFPHASGVDPGGFENNFKVNEFEAKFPEGKVTHSLYG